ncbi:MAG: hypothetical protein GF404_05090 [candidate division Zixibacteria bacterium]|nr:hypothetical protein [candidate division Zixibacteria bacterium]
MSKLNPDIQAVFAAFGQTAYSVQIFEADLITLLIVLRQMARLAKNVKDTPELFLKKEPIEKFWREEGNRIQNQLEKCTLGQLLKNAFTQSKETLNELNEDQTLPSAFKDINKQLDRLPFEDWLDALASRNYLFHRFWYDADDQLGTKEGCYKLKKHLLNYNDQFENHVDDVRKTLKTLMDIMGCKR